MRVRLTVTLDLDPEVWANEYGIPVDRVRDDVRAHLSNVMHEHYVNDLGTAREVVVRRESSHRVGRLQ